MSNTIGVIGCLFIIFTLMGFYVVVNPVLQDTPFQSWQYGPMFARIFPVLLLLFGIVLSCVVLLISAEETDSK